MTLPLQALSLSYLTRNPGKTVLAVAGIAVGVACFVAVTISQRTVADGFQTTIDRLAGKADLQVTGIAGVPEELLETLRTIAGVAAQQPVIEQIVQPAAPNLGSLLVVGIDLVGDRRMRDYRFDGEDADVDDPLVFLAQPDSIALSREFAARAGLAKGDGLTVRLTGATRRLKVRALLVPQGFARAYGGNVAVTDVYAAQDLFGRGRRFDRIDVRVRAGTDVAVVAARIAEAIGSSYRVETPGRRSAGVQRLAGSFARAIALTSFVALGISLFLVFNVFTIAVQRRRRDLGVLRALGATPRQVSVLFLAEAACIGIIGGLVGVGLGAQAARYAFHATRTALETTAGLSTSGELSLTWPVLLAGMTAGIGAALAGAWLPAREAARVAPIDAITAGVFTAVAKPPPAAVSFAGVALLAVAYVVARFGLVDQRWLLPIVATAGALGAVALSGRLGRAVIGCLAPVLRWLMPAAGSIASDALVGHPRRTSATTAVLTVTLAFVLGTAGYLQAVGDSVGSWVRGVVTADLLVRGSSGLAPTATRLTPELRATIAATPGVAEVDAYRQERVPFGEGAISVVAIDGSGLSWRVRHQFVSGDDLAFARAIGSERECVVSDNFSRRYKLRMGDLVTLESPRGPVRLRIAAVVVDFVSDRGTVIMGRPLFMSRWGDDRVDTFHVWVSPGIDPVQVREALYTRLDGVPAIISTRVEFLTEIDRALGALSMLLLAMIGLTLSVAFMAVATSLLISVADRVRDFGLLRALGATPADIGTAVVVEGLMFSIVGVALAVPLGDLLAWLLRARVSGDIAGFHFPRSFPAAALRDLSIALPIVAIGATWLPARWITRLPVRDAISYE